MFTVMYLGNELKLASIDHRPWVPISYLCSMIGIDEKIQVRRLKRHHEKSGLELHVLPSIGSYGATEFHTCIPLEELAWWLRTLRPTDNEAQNCLTKCRHGLVLQMFYQWMDEVGRFGTITQVKRNLNKANPLPPSPPPRRKTGITKKMAKEMAEMYHSSPEMSYSIVGNHFGYSPATICLIINGKYPVALKD